MSVIHEIPIPRKMTPSPLIKSRDETKIKSRIQAASDYND